MKWYLKVLRNYAVFNGRARRKEYWMFVLFNFIVAFLLGLIEALLDIAPSNEESVLADFYSLLILVPSFAVAVRRMHDVGKSGWFCLIPIYNFILAVSEGDKGDNQYGPDPKEIEE